MGEGVVEPHKRKLWERVWPSLTRGNHGGVVWTSLTGGNHEGGGCGRASQEENMKPWGRV